MKALWVLKPTEFHDWYGIDFAVLNFCRESLPFHDSAAPEEVPDLMQRPFLAEGSNEWS
jgi:hypothetical protein